GDYILLVVFVILIEHRRRDYPRRRRGHERLGEFVGLVVEDAQRIVAFEIDGGGAAVLDLANRLGRVEQIDHRALEHRRSQLEETRVANDVTHDGPLASSTKAGHPMLHVSEEAFARLLAVVADVDSRFELLLYDVAGGFFRLTKQRGRIHLLTATALHEHRSQSFATRQAAGVRSENAIFASTHGSSSRVRSLVRAPTYW